MPGFRNLHADLFAMKAIVSLLAICSFPLVWIAANVWLWRIGKWRALLAAVVFSSVVGVVVWFVQELRFGAARVNDCMARRIYVTTLSDGLHAINEMGDRQLMNSYISSVVDTNGCVLLDYKLLHSGRYPELANGTFYYDWSGRIDAAKRAKADAGKK